MSEDYLCHYGVLGMKWGVRKNRKKSSFFSRKAKKKQENQNGSKEEIVKAKKKVKIKDLSDSELQAKVRRLQLEKQYRDLKRDEVSAGKKVLGEILKTSGRTLGVQVANYVGGKAINKVFNDNVVNVGNNKKQKKKVRVKAAKNGAI